MLKAANLPHLPDPQWLLDPHKLNHAREPRGRAVPPHSHIDGMLLLVQEGLLVLQSDQGVASLTPGRIAWIPPGVQLEARWFGHARGTGLFVRAQACSALPAQTHGWRATALTEALFLRLANGLPARLDDRHARQLFDLLVAELNLGPACNLSLPLPQDARLLHLATTLLETPADTRGIDAWAESLNMSPRTLMRRFRAETGVTLGQWRTQARMLCALERLAQGEAVTQVALAVGYESTSAFIGSFREQFGVTPSRYMAEPPSPAAAGTIEHH